MSYVTPYPTGTAAGSSATGPTHPALTSMANTTPGSAIGMPVPSTSQTSPAHGLNPSEGSAQSHSNVPPTNATFPSGPITQRPTLGVVGGPEEAYLSPNQPRSKAAEAGILSVPRDSTYHEDSGIRFPEPEVGPSASASGAGAGTGPSASVEDIPVDAPPSYSEH